MPKNQSFFFLQNNASNTHEMSPKFPLGPVVMHSAPKNTTAHTYDEKIVQQIRNENFTKKSRMHIERNTPAMIVVIAPAVTLIPIVVSALRVRDWRSTASFSMYAFARWTQ